ncbi:hypothetical protein ACPOL_0975 [Acidisarcina polymorpha]|uniref:Uncharacterized protein n=1 Tax=Acidisarcina polymorpha TaxID=2211140 RepID=A0A2Z5FV85_9BACT|nr:hypothetical protein ACPOL_0975 [Acidisarcina polymorpha]
MGLMAARAWLMSRFVAPIAANHLKFLGVETEGPTDRPSVDVKAQDLRVPIAVRSEVETKTTKERIQ